MSKIRPKLLEVIDSIHMNMLYELTRTEYRVNHYNSFQCFLQLIQGPGLLFSSVIILFTDGETPWMSDQPLARSLPTHRTTQTE
jgi:hypothetical protein